MRYFVPVAHRSIVRHKDTEWHDSDGKLSFIASPRERFSCSHENISVTCGECGIAFPCSELQCREVGEGTDSRHAENICPVCGEAECCQLEYECLSDTEIDAITKG